MRKNLYFIMRAFFMFAHALKMSSICACVKLLFTNLGAFLYRHQPVNAQIGIMDGNTFCVTLEPRLFTIDISVPEHESFFEELFKLCDS